MAIIKQEPLGYGTIKWVGINQPNKRFSQEVKKIRIVKDGIVNDKYRGMWRQASNHDLDYIETDNIGMGSTVLNLRQITIVAEDELRAVSKKLGIPITPDMLRANMMVSFQPHVHGKTFSGVRPLSRMVFGKYRSKVLLLTEENGPCRTISRPIAVASNTVQDTLIRDALIHNRGQMAMVRSRKKYTVRAGDTFKIFPPMA